MRSFFCRLMVVALMVFPGVSGWVQADWPQYRGVSQRSARAADPLPLPLQLVWRHQAPAAPAPAWPTSPRMTFDRAMQPVVAGDRVLFGSSAAGSVTVDGLDVRRLRLADVRRNIALVSQEPVLFNDTIYQNLLLGRAEATRDEVIAAAVDAHADDFIRTLPQGYDTIVGERGALLSGGQKQRIALARAFLRNAPILILDEATSALDSGSEAAVQDALRKLVVGKTVLIIAHRFSTIRDASLILVFEQGRITARGTHAELYAGNALYRSLYDRQQGTG